MSELQYAISPSADSTVALEVFKTGPMRKKKHLLFFENFSGVLSYAADKPENSRASFTIEVGSLVCRDAWLSGKQQKLVTHYAKQEALVGDGHPSILFSSRRICAKPLRGFEVEGELAICGIRRMVKVNAVGTDKPHDSLQLDGDATLRLSDFDIRPPSRSFGLVGTKDEALVRLLLWATPAGAPPHR